MFAFMSNGHQETFTPPRKHHFLPNPNATAQTE